MDHYLTYQHNVQAYFLSHKEQYSGVVIPVSIISAFASGTFGFIRALLTSDPDKAYSIDPRTPLFQKAWDREKHLRPAHSRVAEILGEPFSSIGLARALRPEDFEGPEQLARSVQNVLGYQLRFRLRDEPVRKMRKYARLLGLSGDELDHLKVPQFLIPPYFEAARVDDDWIDIARRTIELTGPVYEDVPVRPVLHVSRQSPLAIHSETIRKLGANGFSGVWLYRNDFRELEASVEDLEDLVSTVELCGEVGVGPNLLHGGFFGLVLALKGLRGLCNGVGYGEWRDSGYHRGGLADIRIYVLALHRFVSAEEAQDLIDSDPDVFASDRALLQSCVMSGRSCDEITLQEALNHFLACRQAEIGLIEGEGAEGVLRQLREVRGALPGVGELEAQKYGPALDRWIEVIDRW